MNFLFFLLYQSTALSTRAVDVHQMYSGDSVVGKALTIGIEISPTALLIFTRGQKVRTLASFSTHSTLSRWRLKMQKDIRTLKQYSAVGIITLCPGSMHPWEPSGQKCPTPYNCKVKTCQIVNNSAVDYSISLKFCTEFKRMTPEAL